MLPQSASPASASVVHGSFSIEIRRVLRRECLSNAQGPAKTTNPGKRRYASLRPVSDHEYNPILEMDRIAKSLE